MARLRRDALTLARTSLPVLILGETGTGKSALAEQVLHRAAQGPFVAVDLSAIPSTLVAAELFGTARGAFSGAVERAGRFERRTAARCCSTRSATCRSRCSACCCSRSSGAR